MANLCCVCSVEVPEGPYGIRLGYCSEACFQQWLEEHKNDTILVPYTPLQVTHMTARITIKTSAGLIYNYESWRELYLETRGWTKAQDVRVGDRIQTNGSWETIEEVIAEVTWPKEYRHDDTRPGRPWWERLI